jgi:hypothetical protein
VVVVVAVDVVVDVVDDVLITDARSSPPSQAVAASTTRAVTTVPVSRVPMHRS